jgi:nucleoside-diphosphate-sugar epimerase
MVKKIIITGSSGFIGSNLVEYLSKTPSEFEIIGIDRELFPRETKTPFINYIQDINDPLPDIQDVYAVIHLAAKAGVRESHDKFPQYVRDNILGTKAILDKCVESWKPKIFIYSSSSSVYGTCTSKTKESTPTAPTSPYALTKVACEKLIETYKNNGSLKGTGCCILRFFTVYGPHQREGLAIRTFIKKMIKDDPITVYGDGTQERDFLYIDDLNEAIRKIIIHPYPLEGIYNLSSVNPVSINQIIHLISTTMNKPVTITYEPMNKFDVKKTAADITAFNHATGWIPMVDIKEGIKREIEWAKKEL